MTDSQAQNRSPTELSAVSERKRWKTVWILLGALGPLGYAPASGTVAVAVAGIPLYLLLVTYLTPTQYAVVTMVFILVAIIVHHVGDRILGEADSRRLVWDELAGFLVAMFLVPVDWKYIVIGFFLERAIDIIKVPPANVIDSRWHNGVGVVLDDVVAGVYCCLLLHLVALFL